MNQVISQVTDYIENGDRPHCIFAVNPEKNFSVPKDPSVYDTFKSADLLIPDGIGVVIALRILYGIKLSRITGVELMHSICELSARKGYKVFIYGAREEVNKSAAERLCVLYPGLTIAGRANGYIEKETMDNLVQQINASGAQILFLALGSPRQEKWFAAYKHSLENIRVCQGISGTLDTIVGNVPRAPEVWQRIGLEWLYRLLSDPRRIKRQQALPLFAALVLWSKLKSLALGSTVEGRL
jgi:N-acetylglucosaminyldiphosphoundecaprenol N-acetyl-beta-D-mannosaminyltransferase